jgi:hypothetical protein
MTDANQNKANQTSRPEWSFTRRRLDGLCEVHADRGAPRCQ